MLVQHGTWVLVMDGEKYLLLENTGKPDQPALRVLRAAQQDNPPNREQATDRPGRYPDPSKGRSAVEETDWHRLEKVRFAEMLADYLRKWALDGRFEHLVLVSAPATLGTLRQKLHPEVSKRIVAELPKDLTGHSIDRIGKILTEAPEPD